MLSKGNKRKKAKQCGFLSRMKSLKSQKGASIIKRKRSKGRHVLAPASIKRPKGRSRYIANAK